MKFVESEFDLLKISDFQYRTDTSSP